MTTIHEGPKSMSKPASDRSRRARRPVGLLLICCLSGSLLLATRPTEAQTRCGDDQSFEECWKETFKASEAELSKATEEGVETQTVATTTELSREPTGTEADIAGVRSNTRDYLPLLALSGLLGEASHDENDKNVLVFDLNFLVPWLSDSKNSKLRGLLNTQPTVATALAEMLPEEGRADRIQELEQTLSDVSDVGFSLSYSQELLNWGRGFENYRNRYAALLQTAHDSLPTLNDGVTLAAELTEEVNRLFPDGTAGDDVLALTPNGIIETLAEQCRQEEELCRSEAAEERSRQEEELCPSEALEERCRQEQELCRSEALGTKTELRHLFEAFIDAELSAYEQLDALYREQGIDAFADLLDNQPQLIFEISHRDREELVGADETIGTFRLEWSKANLKNAMSRECHEQLEDEDYLDVGPSVRSECLKEYREYVAARRNTIEKGHRISFSIDYADVDDISVPHSVLGQSPEESTMDDGPIVIPGSNRLDVSLGWSRTFNGDGGSPVVFDLVATYERLEDSDDTFRPDDRILATLSITRSFGGVEVPFAVVYANHGEFLTEVDEQLSAHVGLRYDLGGVGRSK